MGPGKALFGGSFIGGSTVANSLKKILLSTADPSTPPLLLEDILQSELPLDIAIANVSTEADSATLENAMHDYLALQLDTSRSTISSVRVSSVEKTVRPLIQVRDHKFLFM